MKKPGWKQRKEGCSPKKNERSCCLLSGQTGEVFATCRGNKTKLHPSLPAVGMMETATRGLKQNNLDCLWLFPLQSTETFILKRKHLWSCSGVCAWRCASTFVLWDTNSPGSLHCRISNQKNLAILSVQGVAGQGRLCLSPFLNNRAHNVVLGVPRNWEFGIFNCLGLWGSFAFNFFLVYKVLTVN